MRISLFCGTRPEAIKLAPVVHALQHHPHLKPHLCITGQHTDLLTPMLEFFQLQPNVHLRWERLHRSLPESTSRLTEAIDGYLEETKPDMVLVQGDTASTFTAALTAFYHQIPLGHIEAGLRTGSLQAPFPEEAYRQLTTRLADLHFASTPSNRQHLLDEGISAEKIHLTGNTVVDALRWARKQKVSSQLPPAWSSLLSSNHPLVVVTCHRRESWDEGMEIVGRSLRRLAHHCPDVQFLLPLHPNPRVREPLRRALSGGKERHNLHLGEPLAYPAMLELLEAASLVMTDSGGIQEEAAALKTPVLVLREKTDRPEAVDAGMALLVGLEEGRIVSEAVRLLHSAKEREQMMLGSNPFGDGKAAERIVETCYRFLAGLPVPPLDYSGR